MEDATLIQSINNRFVLRARADGAAFPLHGEMLVGREADCAIALHSGHISRYHAKINVSPNGVYVEDLHSTNGTSVNGRKIKGRVKLSLGDLVAFDSVRFELSSDMPSRQDATALAPSRQSPAQDRSRSAKPTPIRPSLVASKTPAERVGAAERTPAPEVVFPKADEIDLERSAVSRDPASVEADFERQLQQRFHELDELMDLPGARSAPIESPSPLGAHAPADDAAEPITGFDSAGGPRADGKADQLPAVRQPQEEDRTQLLSTAQLDHFIERHRFDYDLNIGSGPRLIVTTAPLRGKLFSLQDYASGVSLQIGRDSGAQVFINDRTISTDHARITLSQDTYTLTATHAKNGIMVNGVSQNRTVLNHNDKIQIGRTELVFKTDIGIQEFDRAVAEDPLVVGHGRRYGIIVTVIALLVLVGAILATAQ